VFFLIKGNVMCRKLILLTSFVLVLGMGTSAWAEYVNDTQTWGATNIQDLTDKTLEIGPSGDLTITGRVNMDDEAQLIMSGGTLTTLDTFKFPDNAGEQLVQAWINSGTWDADEIQNMAGDGRGDAIYVGGGTITLQHGYLETAGGSTRWYDPNEWLYTQSYDGHPTLMPAPGYVSVIIIDDGNGACTITAQADDQFATDPNPGERAEGMCPNTLVLSWTPAGEIVDPNHDVYLDPNLNNVIGVTRDTNEDVLYYSENQDSNEYTVSPALELNTTYYWRVDEVDNNDPCVWESPVIWSFTTEDGNASDPDPPDGRRGVNPADVVLNWTPSCIATAQQVVYLSTDFNDVNTMQPGAIEDTVGATDNNCPVGTLATYTNYYWRIKTDTGGNGEVWAFKTGYGGLLMEYSFEGSLGSDITDPVIDDTGKITFFRYEGGGTLKYGEGRFGGTSALFDSNVGLFRLDPCAPTSETVDPLRLDGYQYSIHFWLKPTYLSGLDIPDQRLIGKRPGPWAIHINNVGSGDNRTNDFKFFHFGQSITTENNTAREDEWVHLAVVYNQPDYDVYLNGIWANGMSRPIPCPSDNNNPIGIGCRIQQPDPGTYLFSQFFDGFMDELKIWDIAVLPVPGVSTNPSPPHLADRLDPCDANNTVLSWTPGPFADRHDVYFGTDANVAYQGTVDGKMYPESGNFVLELGKTYYWRIDDVNDGDAKTYEGFLWNFSTKSAIVDPNMVVWYKFDELYGDDVTDSSGYYNHGEIWNRQGDTWDPCDGRFYPGCIHFNNNERVDVVGEVFDYNYIEESISISVWWKEAYRVGDENHFCGFGDADLHLLVRAPDSESDNPGVIWRAGNDTNDVLEWTTNGLAWMDNWHHLVFTKNGPEGTMKIYFDAVLVDSHDDANGTTLSQAFAAAAAGNGFRIGANRNHGADFIGKADDLRVYDYEIDPSKINELYRGGDVERAWAPVPIDGASDVPTDVGLLWRSGDFATHHDVYFGKDRASVRDANLANQLGVYEQRQVVSDTNYAPGLLDLGETYYWRIDEVNETNNPDDIWKGDVWSFTVANFIIIDDFEDYDNSTNKIFDTWEDGNVNFTGAFLDLGVEPFDPVHIGEQSMLFVYDNTIKWDWDHYWSEVKLPFAPARDFTEADVKVLTLYFYGSAGNDANDTEELYVGLEGSLAEVRYSDDHGNDNNDIRLEEWIEWNVAISEFSGVDPCVVTGLLIGFGDRDNTSKVGGEGVVYFDDIRLNLPKCMPELLKPAADLNNDCIVSWGDVEVMGVQWLRADACMPTTLPSPGPVAHWEFEEGDSNSVSDSANSHDGVAEGGYAWVEGKIGTWAMEFSGGRVLVPDHNQLRPENAVSATAWVFSQSQDQSNRVVVKGADNAETYALQVTGNNRASFIIRDSDPCGSNIYSVGTGDTYRNEWMHLAGVCSGDTNTVSIYVNGQLAESDSDANFMEKGLTLSQDTNDLAIGNRSDATDRSFEGIIDDTRIYDRALTDAEVAWLATEGSGYWPLESPANLYNEEPTGQKAVNIRDAGVLLNSWLEEKLWPE
jgi:hypothetical protein